MVHTTLAMHMAVGDLFFRGLAHVLDVHIEMQRNACERVIAVEHHCAVLHLHYREHAHFAAFTGLELHAGFHLLLAETILRHLVHQLWIEFAVAFRRRDLDLQIFTTLPALHFLLEPRHDHAGTVDVRESLAARTRVQQLAIGIVKGVVEGNNGVLADLHFLRELAYKGKDPSEDIQPCAEEGRRSRTIYLCGPYSMPVPLLTIRDLHFRRGEKAVVHGVDLDLTEGEVLFVVGPSGCGKTTLLRLIAGLEAPMRGTIEMHGKTISGNGILLAPEKRTVGMVFQGLALFPHLTVEANIGFGLHGIAPGEKKRRVQEELRAVGLEGLEARYPHELSGGQQQRVALARSLVLRPKVILMDEPFSDLDSRTRAQVRNEVDRILQAHGTAAIIVSHDREDAYHLGDRIAVMEDGRVVRVESAEILRHEWTEHPFEP